jgi:hypothetical protein
MSRNLGTPMISAITSNGPIGLALLVDLTLADHVEYVWSGVGSFVWSGHTYTGVGSLGSMGDVKEGIEVKAEGTSIGLSGIDPVLLNDCLNDIRVGAPVTVWFAIFEAGAMVGSPYPLFVGTVDQPALAIGVDSMAIQLKLENRMINHQRPTNRLYTSSDQQYYYPDDIGCHWVEQLSDIALVWG